ncbi:cell division protein ZapE [Coxiella burnetii]|nr:cell division protein ZapE [Coxiella burnetii]OYK80879.1 cell division protein ZapE [Coxiella burnetii]OYK82966.1 cell division protein ZapE [Coxiella burnetii]
MTPLEYYQQQVEFGFIQKDPQQKEVIDQLQHIYTELLKQENARTRFLNKFLHTLVISKPVKGLYLWGSVGVGKTFLLDTFYHCLPLKKMRLHFHQFMARIHRELTHLQGIKNPLDIIAKKLSRETNVICFDEFFVDNVADAMLLGGLLSALFKYGICFIATSNFKPEDLYKEGLQREQFIPAIKLIKQHTQVFHLTSHYDYRLRYSPQTEVYFTPLDEQAEINMEKSFQHFSNYQPATHTAIELFHRIIPIRKQAGNVIWFEFIDLCGIPRSVKDFLELSQKYKTVLISNVPVLRTDQKNLITSFIKLIDVFYDAKIRLIISAQAPIEELYPEGPLRFEFARTQSRLTEMQRIDWGTDKSQPFQF